MPIFAVIALGYFTGRVRDIDYHHVDKLDARVMNFALSASLFVATAPTSRPLVLAQWPFLIVLIVPMLALYGVCYWMQRRLFSLASNAASVADANNIASELSGGGPTPDHRRVRRDEHDLGRRGDRRCRPVAISSFVIKQSYLDMGG